MYLSWDREVSRPFLAEPVGVVQGLGRVELAAVGGADQFLDFEGPVRAGDDGALVDVVVAADVVVDVVVLQAGEESVLHVGFAFVYPVKRRILVVFAHEILVGEDESMLGAAGVLVKPAADPGLLVGDGVAVGVADGVDALAGRCPVVDDDEAGVVARGTVIEGVTHAVQVGADRRRAVEVGGTEGVGCSAAGSAGTFPELR